MYIKQCTIPNMSESPCFSCKNNCCKRIYLSGALNAESDTEIQTGLLKFTTRFPQFYVLYWEENASGILYPILGCNWYDSKNRNCLHHESPRPRFCLDAGTEYKPSSNCILWDSTHPTNKSSKRFFFF